jgi:hypothetical protein
VYVPHAACTHENVPVTCLVADLHGRMLGQMTCKLEVSFSEITFTDLDGVYFLQYNFVGTHITYIVFEYSWYFPFIRLCFSDFFDSLSICFEFTAFLIHMILKILE